jgi:hypothetical protein
MAGELAPSAIVSQDPGAMSQNAELTASLLASSTTHSPHHA